MSAEQPYPYQVSFEAAAALYAKHGLSVTPPLGNNHWGKSMVCAEHDGVPYCMNTHNSHGKLDPSKVAHVVEHRKQTIERHHDVVKAVYQYCMSQGFGPVWAMCGGGAQLQVFFGCKDGYVAILYLSLESRWQEEVDDELQDGAYVLQIQSGSYDDKFAAMNIPGVTPRTWAEVYGSLPFQNR